MKKIIVGLLLVLGVSAFVAQAEPVSMTGVVWHGVKAPTYWFLGKVKSNGEQIAQANIPPRSGAERLEPFEGKMVKITGELIPDLKAPTFDKGFTVEAVEVSP